MVCWTHERGSALLVQEDFHMVRVDIVRRSRGKEVADFVPTTPLTVCDVLIEGLYAAWQWAVSALQRYISRQKGGKENDQLIDCIIHAGANIKLHNLMTIQPSIALKAANLAVVCLIANNLHSIADDWQGLPVNKSDSADLGRRCRQPRVKTITRYRLHGSVQW